MAHSLRPALAGVFLFVSLAGCSTAPALRIPEPLPEALEWSRPAEETGNFLGLRTRENDSGSLDALTFEPGVRVARVIEGSPAERAGLQVGDVVLAWDGEEVNDPAAFDALVRSAEADAEARLWVLRDDTVFEVPVRLESAAAGSLAPVEVVYRRDPSRSVAGWADADGGALLAASDPRAPFPRAGIPVGSLVLALEGRPVRSARDLVRRMHAMAPGTEVDVAFEEPDGTRGEAVVELLDEERVVTGFQVPILMHYTDDLEGDSTEFALVDLWVISLFRYVRNGNEREYRFLRWIRFSSGAGELGE